jgi:hypothetical protein
MDGRGGRDSKDIKASVSTAVPKEGVTKRPHTPMGVLCTARVRASVLLFWPGNSRWVDIGQ